MLTIARQSGSLFAICDLLFVISFEPQARMSEMKRTLSVVGIGAQ
jgi:hypothetical protein